MENQICSFREPSLDSFSVLGHTLVFCSPPSLQLQPEPFHTALHFGIERLARFDANTPTLKKGRRVETTSWTFVGKTIALMRLRHQKC